MTLATLKTIDSFVAAGACVCSMAGFTNQLVGRQAVALVCWIGAAMLFAIDVLVLRKVIERLK